MENGVLIFRHPRTFLVPALLLLTLIVVGTFVLTQSASALPPAGSDTFNVSAEVSVESRLGEETIPLTGTFGVDRSDPVIDEDTGVEVVTMEIVSIELEGESLTGAVEVFANPGFTSHGELRSLQVPPDQFPADSFFDIFVEAAIPTSGSRSSPTVHNELPIHLIPIDSGEQTSLDEWPPTGVTYEAEIDECIPLLPELPAEICVDAVSIEVGEPKTPTPTDTPCPPEECTPTFTPSPTIPTPTLTPVSPTPTSTPTAPPLPEDPSFSTAAGGPSGAHPADILGLGDAGNTPTGNDNFADAFEIATFPFTGVQNTTGATTETGEELNPSGCLIVEPNAVGATVWYYFVAPITGTFIASTAGSNYDTVLSIYSGSSLETKAALGCDDDSGPGTQSEFSIPLAQGNIYYLQAGGWNAASGNLVLNVDFAGAGAGGGLPGFIPCSSLGLSADGCDNGADGDQDDLDALSFGHDFQAGDFALAFSVAPGSNGLGTSGVAQQADCSPAEPQADEFTTDIDGTNELLFDGDGMGEDCPTSHSLGLMEVPTSDDLDALNEQPPSAVDDLGDGTLDDTVFFSLAEGSPSLASLNRQPADVLWAAGGAPGVYASADSLGLQSGDDIDALCVRDVGGGPTYSASTDVLLFSLAPGSSTLAILGASAADVLAPGPRVHIRANQIGLQNSDDLDAMKCFEDAEPDVVFGDASCDGQINAIDAAITLQFIAGLLTNLTCTENADANGDGQVTAIDSALILQYTAGLLTQLPP